MTRPRTFDEAFRARQAVRKRGDTLPPLPPGVEAAREEFVATVAASLTTEDTAAALEAAIQEAAAQIIAKAIQTVEAELRAGRPGPAVTREEEPMTEPQQWVAKGGDAWSKIQAGATALVAKSGGKVSPAEAVSKFLDTSEGKRLYDEYLREERQVVQQHARNRLAPPF